MLPLRHGDSYYIGRLLNGAYQIVYARNGAEGLEIAAEQMPDLILTDLMMPEMDGYELCRRVRESEVLNHIEILDGQIATLVNHRDRSGGVGCTWKYIINQSGYNPSSRITLVYRASVTMGNVTCLQWAL